MRTRHLRNRPVEGSVLLLSIVITSILVLTLGSYLFLVQTQHRLVARSQSWNSSLAVAEAGVEEALAQVNPGAAVGSLDVGANGWGPPAGGYYGPVTRTMLNGRYRVVFTDMLPPVIYSTGFVNVAGSRLPIARTLRVGTRVAPLFDVALGARFMITMKGSGVASDSFNSQDPALSTNGQYDPTKTSTNGDVASVYGPVDLGNHLIQGDLYLGPTADFNSGTNQVSGAVNYDFNLDFPDVVPPPNFTSWVTATAVNTNIGGVVYKYAFFSSSDYTLPANDNSKIYIAPNAKVRLRVTSSSWTPGAVFVAGMTNNAAKLTVYMAGKSSTLGGNTVVQSGNAANFAYYGLPTNTEITYSGTSCFIGTIYAPSAEMTLDGGGNNNGVIGACIVKTLRLNGHYNFHYDESLLNAGPVRGYIPFNWQEL